MVPAGTLTDDAVRLVNTTNPVADWPGMKMLPVASAVPLAETASVILRAGTTPEICTSFTSGEALTGKTRVCFCSGRVMLISADGMKTSTSISSARTPAAKTATRRTGFEVKPNNSAPGKAVRMARKSARGKRLCGRTGTFSCQGFFWASSVLEKTLKPSLRAATRISRLRVTSPSSAPRVEAWRRSRVRSSGLTPTEPCLGQTSKIRGVLAQAMRSRMEIRSSCASSWMTWVFIAPMLPMNPAQLAELIAPYAGRVMMDPLNYRRQVQSLFRRQGWEYALTDEYAAATRAELLPVILDRRSRVTDFPGVLLFRGGAG